MSIYKSKILFYQFINNQLFINLTYINKWTYLL